MITEIGITAGDIWHYLEKHGSADLNQLLRSISGPKDLILMSLGWLAREGHITLGDAASNFTARLNSNS